jgi:Zn finger protein HypA/HybF involved in hydrogenase expression
MLIVNSTVGSATVRKRLIREGIKKNRCEDCGLDSWRGQPLRLELHHVNGVHTDNRLENLRILCPNCHAVAEAA